jgi:tetratricopeptide (TPR) repeat protein
LAVVVLLTACAGKADEAVSIQGDGVDFIHEERWEEAVSAFTEVIELEPDIDLLVSAHLNRSLALVELGRTEAAIADETVVISLASGEPLLADALAQAHLNRSREFSSLGRWSDALADAEAVVALNPDNQLDLAKAHFNRANMLGELGRYQDALVAVTEVINLNPQHEALLTDAHEYRLWLIRENDGSPEDMIAAASAVIDFAPNDVEVLAEAYLMRGATYVFLGLFDAEAEADLQTVIALLPANHEWSLSAKELLLTIIE